MFYWSLASLEPQSHVDGYEVVCSLLFTPRITKLLLFHVCVGSLKELDVIDVDQQEEAKMLMREWTEYFLNTKRPRILNVVSLEFTGTK